VIYVYAITDAPRESPPPTEPGLLDAPLQLTTDGDLTVIYSALRGDAPPTPQNVRRHESVVEQLMTHCTALPMRFGTLLPDEEQLRSTIAENRERFASDLNRLAGCVEMGLRVFDGAQMNSEALPPATTGLDYMMRRLSAERRLQHLRSEIHGALATLSRESVFTSAQSRAPRQIFASAYLVERSRAELFQAQVQTLINQHPGVRILCTGPWPPYHFVSPTARAGIAGEVHLAP
jgi:hypothetical protein